MSAARAAERQAVRVAVGLSVDGVARLVGLRALHVRDWEAGEGAAWGARLEGVYAAMAGVLEAAGRKL